MTRIKRKCNSGHFISGLDFNTKARVTEIEWF